MARFRTLLCMAALLGACSGSDTTGPGGIDSVAVSAAVTTVIVGAFTQYTATARDADGSVVSVQAIEWSSSAPAVATVSPTGLVSAVGAGQATITASVGGKSGSLAITVAPNPSGSAIVSMPGFTFSPFTTNINVGGTVIYEFPAEPHNVIFGATAGAPTDIQITSRRRVARTFTVAGDFPYDCTIHPGMQGVVLVR